MRKSKSLFFFFSPLLGLIFDNVPDHTIAFLEALNARTDFVDFTCDIAADDRWELLNEDPGVLLVPVDGIDGDGRVLDDDLARTCGWHWGRADFEGSVCLLEPGGLVLWRGHVDRRCSVSREEGCGDVWFGLVGWLVD